MTSMSVTDRLFNESRGRSPPRRPKPYSIDSRCGFLQQNHIGPDRICVAFDIDEVGPGSHHPQLLQRHVSTPMLGRRNDVVHDIIMTPLRSYSGMDYETAINENKGLMEEKGEFATLFHNHDSRIALDPKNKRAATPGPQLAHDSLLEERQHDGLRIIRNIHFGRNDIPFGERTVTRQALPSYDAKFDSEVRSEIPRKKLGVFLKSSRFKHYDAPPPEPEPEPKPTTPFEEDPMFSPVSRLNSSHRNRDEHNKFAAAATSSISTKGSEVFSDHKTLNKNSYDCTQNRRPMKMRKKLELKFDDSCYKKLRQKVELVEQNPRAISDSVKAHMFNGIYTISRPHNTKKIDTQIIERMKKYA